MILQHPVPNAAESFDASPIIVLEIAELPIFILFAIELVIAPIFIPPPNLPICVNPSELFPMLTVPEPPIFNDTAAVRLLNKLKLLLLL